MPEQPVNNKGCSNIQVCLREFNQEHEKVLLSFLRLVQLEKILVIFFCGKNVSFPEIQFFFQDALFLFFKLRIKSGPGSYIYYYCQLLQIYSITICKVLSCWVLLSIYSNFLQTVIRYWYVVCDQIYINHYLFLCWFIHCGWLLIQSPWEFVCISQFLSFDVCCMEMELH